MLRGFAELPEGTYVWTRAADGLYRLGRIAGPWRYDGTAAARAVGICHVRSATWLERPFGDDEVPAPSPPRSPAAAATSSASMTSTPSG